jgi:hypothetical protein
VRTLRRVAFACALVVCAAALGEPKNKKGKLTEPEPAAVPAPVVTPEPAPVVAPAPAPTTPPAPKPVAVAENQKQIGRAHV